MAAPKVGFFPDPQLQLLAYLRRRGVDPHGLEPANVFLPQFGVDDMQPPLVAIKALLDERQQDGIELIRAAEECADMTVAVQWRAGKAIGQLTAAKFGVAATVQVTLPAAPVDQLKAEGGAEAGALSSNMTATLEISGAAQKPDQRQANVSARLGGLTIETKVLAVGG